MRKKFVNIFIKSVSLSFLMALSIGIVNSSLAQSKNSPFKEGLVVRAVKSGRMEDLIGAINSGSSVNERDFDEVPALLLSVERSKMDMIFYLLEKGARTDLKDPSK